MAVDKIEKAIRSILANDANVSGVVGTKIYYVSIPQKATMPAIGIEQLTGPREHTLDGPFGMAAPQYQVNCWASTYGGTRTLSDYVRIALDGYSGTTGTVKIYVGLLNNESDLFERLPDGNERFGKALTFTVWYEEATT